MGDLDDIWAAQAGKHEAIVKNIHELLAKLAWDFSPDQVFKSKKGQSLETTFQPNSYIVKARTRNL